MYQASPKVTGKGVQGHKGEQSTGYTCVLNLGTHTPRIHTHTHEWKNKTGLKG